MYYTELEGEGVVVRQLVQALPEKRLATLIGQGRFDDAEELAKRFSLDPEVHTHPAQIGEQFNFSRPLGTFAAHFNNLVWRIVEFHGRNIKGTSWQYVNELLYREFTVDNW